MIQSSLLTVSPPEPKASRGLLELTGLDLIRARGVMQTYHYTHLLPSGKSHWLSFEAALIVWSIPANCNIGRFLLGAPCKVWELSRLWAPDGHRGNLLTQALSAAVKWITKMEHPDILVSYADPSAGHLGGIYRAASWIYDGQSDDPRNYITPDGKRVGRRTLHSGQRHWTRQEIKEAGYEAIQLPGKHRFLKPISHRAKTIINNHAGLKADAEA